MSESKIVVFKETETSPAKRLSLLQVTGVEESTVGESGNTNKERVVIDSQESLLSSCDEGSEGLEKLLRDKLDSLSGEGLERFVEVDPTVVLQLLHDSSSPGKNVVPAAEEIPRRQVHYVLRSE